MLYYLNLWDENYSRFVFQFLKMMIENLNYMEVITFVISDWFSCLHGFGVAHCDRF